MAAARSSGSTGLQVGLGISVTVALISLILLGVIWGDYQTSVTNAATQSASATESKNAVSRLTDEIETLKKDLGYESFSDVGVGEPPPENSVRKALLNDLATLGVGRARPFNEEPVVSTPPSVAAVLQTMRTSLDASTAESQAAKDGMALADNRLKQAETAYKNLLQEVQNSQTTSETDKQKLVTTQNELIAKKDSEIAKYREEARALSVEKANIADELENVRKEKDEEIAQLTTIVDDLRLQIDEIVKPSFEVADGSIVRVDNTPPGTAYIDLGSDDGLRVGVTFSVYTQTHQGVGRNLNDIKGKIQVIEIKNENLAVCRILEQFNDKPMHAGDPIYTPLWSAGLKEEFSFVGLIDLDGDGASDRELLHDILNHNGAGVEVEIDDDGELTREGASLTVNTKFLVIGEIPDPSKFAGFDEKQRKAQAIINQRTSLISQAQKQGIRVVNLRDFLAYIGYKPQQSRWRPGDNKLKPVSTTTTR